MTLSAVVRIGHVGLGTVETVAAAAAMAGDVVLVAVALDPRARGMVEGLARRHGARLVERPARASEGAVRNAGVRATREAAVLLLDAGDRPEAAVAAALAARIAEGAAVAAAPVRVERLDGGGRLHVPPEPDALGILTAPDAVPSAFVLSRRAFDAVGGFDEALVALADADFWARAAGAGPIALHGESPLVTRTLAAAAASAPATPRGAFEALHETHAARLDEDPARVLGALERRIAALDDAHGPLLAARAAGIAELHALDAEIKALEHELGSAGRHAVEWGDLRRLSPVSREWGYDRGLPLDRPYIEAFVAEHAADVRGAVLEVQEGDYTARFGGERVTRAEIVDVDAGNPRATVLADLRHADALADAAFDCFILTQTLHVVDDMKAALREAHRVLKPGGVLLLTFPSSSRVCVEYGPRGDFWRVTEAGARALVEEAFPAGEVSVHAYGNVLTSAGFLYGLGAEELTADERAAYDPYFPMLIGVRARKAGGAADAARPVARRRAGLPRVKGGAVLMYHRVADPARDVHGLSVPPAQFRTHLDLLAGPYEVVPLADLVRWVEAGRDPAGLVALTFDDGYLDNLTHASPVLVEAGLPATFFVTTEHLDRAGEFWWDTLERLFLSDRPLPPALDLNGVRPHLHLDTSTAAARREAHALLHPPLVAAPLQERRAVMERLLEWSGQAASPAAARPLLAPEVAALAGRPGHAIGCHGVHHLALGRQPDGVAAREIAEAARRLGETLGRPVTSFAYPYGDVSEAAVAAARATGMESAVTCEQAPVRPGMDPLRVPRIEVKAGAADALGERLWQLLR